MSIRSGYGIRSLNNGIFLKSFVLNIAAVSLPFKSFLVGDLHIGKSL